LVFDERVDLGFERANKEFTQTITRWKVEEFNKVWDGDRDPAIAACPASFGKVVSAVKRPP
jgi:hypothetical protein